MGLVALSLVVSGFFLIVVGLGTLPFGLIFVVLGIIVGIVAVAKNSAKVLGIIALVLAGLAIISAPVSFVVHGASLVAREVERTVAERQKPQEQPPITISTWPGKSEEKGPSYSTDGLTVTINSVRKATGDEEGLLGPPSGPNPNLTYVWVAVNLTIRNGSRELKQNPGLYIPMKIIDGQGNEFTGDGGLLSKEEEKQEPLIFSEFDRLSAGENRGLPARQEVAGNVWFTIWDKSTGLKLVYKPFSLLGENRQLEWPLKQ